MAFSDHHDYCAKLFSTCADETEYVRRLAEDIIRAAASDRMTSIMERWRRVNNLEPTDRAPVWCRPVGAWKEILPPERLHCRNPLHQAAEQRFRKQLIKLDIGDDEPIYSTFPISAVFDCDPPTIWGVEIGRHASQTAGGAWAYDPPLKTPADLEKLACPTFRYNREETEKRVTQMQELLGGVMDVVIIGNPRLNGIIGTTVADLVGLEQMMMNFMLEPQFMHDVTVRVHDAAQAALTAAEESGVYTPFDYGPMYESRPFGAAHPGHTGTAANSWGVVNSQEYDQVSPDMWEEFCLHYHKSYLSRFGRSAYGCCENLTHKIDGVLSIPNLRIFVCSAWTDLDLLLKKLNEQTVIMWRQKASDVVFPRDEAVIARDLEKGTRKLRGRPYQIILRELETLCGHDDRLHVWTRHAVAAAEQFA